MSVKTQLVRLKLKASKHGPQIATVAGVVGFAVAGVWACKRTMKLPELIKKHNEVMESIDDAKENDEDYSEKDAQHDTFVEYKTMTVHVIKLYGMPTAIAVGSTVCIIGSHVVMNRRNAALGSALTIMTTQFKNYRKNVIKELGEEADRNFRFNLKEKLEESENEDPENPGGENSEKQNKNPLDEYNDFSRIFYEGSPGWTEDPEQNKYYLLGQQDYANKKLQLEGVLFLNDVYEILGYPKTKAGQIMGWIYDTSKCPISDNYVDFGIFDTSNEAAIRFVNGYERSIILDFNCANILDYV